MRTTRAIYDSLVKAPEELSAVRLLSDDELRQIRGALARRDFEEWPAEKLYGVCVYVCCERFCYPAEGKPQAEAPKEQVSALREALAAAVTRLETIRETHPTIHLDADIAAGWKAYNDAREVAR